MIYYLVWWVITRGLAAVANVQAHARATHAPTGSGYTKDQIIVINNLCYTVVLGDVLCLVILVLSALRVRDSLRTWWTEHKAMAGSGLRNYPQ